MRDDVARLSAAVRDAAGRGARLVPRGAGRWWPEVAPEAAVLDCAVPALAPRIDAADLVATAPAAMTLEALDAALGAQGMYLAIDPPGPSSRTLGGALAAGGGGPLAALFGNPRDQVLGLTFLAGNGVVAKCGGRVVKNVAGFDLAKLVIGGHGAFGVIIEAHLRLRARPEADRTATWSLGPDPAAATGRLMLAGAAPAAFEVVSPALASALGLGGAWTLLVRAMGTAEGVEEELAHVAETLRQAARVVTDASLWSRWRETVGGWPVLTRIGADPAAWMDAAALAQAIREPLGLSITVPRGTVRAGFGRADATDIARLRSRARSRRWPVTLERAGASLRAEAGVWGAMDGDARRLTDDLRRVFDPDGVFEVPLFAPATVGAAP
jgi:glycolate oxidase FAD binding subunit